MHNNETSSLPNNPQDTPPPEDSYHFWDHWAKDPIMGAKIHVGTPQALEGPEIVDKYIGCYGETARWRGNPMDLPIGEPGEEFIEGVGKILKHITNEDELVSLASTMLHVFNALMLQKPAPKSTKEQNKDYLAKRLIKWKEGRY